MVPLADLRSGRIRSVLALGAHADDIEIGCGGTLLKLLDADPRIAVTWVVLSATPPRDAEARAGAATFLAAAAHRDVRVCGFRERYFPYDAALKATFDALGAELSGDHAPDLVLTHRRADRHQDHRTVGELTWNTFRDALILEYEIPKYEGDLGQPNVFVHLDADHVDRKVDGILGAFPSQRDKHWFSADTYRAVLRLRGVESKAPGGYAEAFHGPKLVLA